MLDELFNEPCSSASTTPAMPSPIGSSPTAPSVPTPLSATRLRRPSPLNSLQWTIGSAHLKRCADRLSLRRRNRAKFKRLLWSHSGELRGSQPTFRSFDERDPMRTRLGDLGTARRVVGHIYIQKGDDFGLVCQPAWLLRQFAGPEFPRPSHGAKAFTHYRRESGFSPESLRF